MCALYCQGRGTAPSVSTENKAISLHLWLKSRLKNHVHFKDMMSTVANPYQYKLGKFSALLYSKPYAKTKRMEGSFLGFQVKQYYILPIKIKYFI